MAGGGEVWGGELDGVVGECGSEGWVVADDRGELEGWSSVEEPVGSMLMLVGQDCVGTLT